MLDVYVEEKEEFINREFLVSTPHLKRGNIVWNCVKYNITKEKEDYEAIGIRWFEKKHFRKRRVGEL